MSTRRESSIKIAEGEVFGFDDDAARTMVSSSLKKRRRSQVRRRSSLLSDAQGLADRSSLRSDGQGLVHDVLLEYTGREAVKSEWSGIRTFQHQSSRRMSISHEPDDIEEVELCQKVLT